jgi:putative hydrolase of the HAD superfamily
MTTERPVVLFDFVGTLVFPDPSVADIYYRFGRDAGSRLDQLEIAQRFSGAYRSLDRARSTERTDQNSEIEFWKSVVRMVFSDIANIEEIFHRLWIHFGSPLAWRLYEDVSDTLTSLTDQGCLIGIASNFDDRLLSLGDLVQNWCAQSVIFYSSQVGYRKPSLGFFRTIQQKLRRSPSQILFVGDDPVNDVNGALQAGWKVIHLRRHERENIFAGVPMISTLKELCVSL